MKKVQIIGAAIVDVLVNPADQRVFEIGSCPADQIVMSYGGDALNEATVLHKLGGNVHLHTILGDDEAGRAVLRRIEQVGLETTGVTFREDLRTSVNVVLVKPSGERCFLTDPQASQRKLRLEDIPMPFPADTGILCFASMFVFPQMKTAEMAAVFRAAKEQGITVCADMTKRKNGESTADVAEALQYLDYLFPNDAEAMLLTGRATVEEAAADLLAAGVGTVVVKCGAKGCYITNRERTFWVAPEAAVTVVDTTGAGDSFVGGFLYALSQDLPLEECARTANRCGAQAVQKIGATTWIAG